MGNRHSRTPAAPNRKKGEAAEGVRGPRQHENPATTWSKGNQESASAKPKELRVDSNKQFSGVVLASDTLPPRAFFSASLKRSLSSRERSATLRSSSTRVTGPDGSAPAPPDRARRPSRGGLRNQDIKLAICCQRAPKSGWDNSVFGTSSHQASCGLESGASTAQGACQGMLGSKARARLSLAPGVSYETLCGQENFCLGDRRVPRGGSLTLPRKSRRERSDVKASGARTRSSTPPVVKCWERTSKKKVVLAGTRKSVGSDQDSARARVQGITDKIPSNVQRERRVIIGHNGSVGTRRSKEATSGRMLSEGARVRRNRWRDSMQTRQGTYTALDKEDEQNENMCPPLHVPGAEWGAEGEVLSVSSANSMTPEGLTVSVSSLPPVETAATGTELIFDESSFEDSLASLSLPSSSDKNGFEVGVGEGGETDENGRGKRGRPYSRHRGSSDTFGRTRSTGSFNLARIHEQKEGRGVYRPTEETIARSAASRDSDSECGQLQELSDSGNEALEEGSSTVSATSPTMAPPWNTLNIASPTVNFWHHRAALELRNLTLEREVEQLKVHLRNIGGTDVDVPQQETRRSILPPRQQRRGERATDTSGVTATLQKGKTFGSTGALTPASVRSMARFSLPETPKPINIDPNRGSVEAGDGTNRRKKNTSERERKSSDPPKQGGETPAARKSYGTGSGEDDSIDITEPVPSSQSKYDQRLSGTRTLNMPEVPGGAVSTATIPWACSPSSARQLRATRPPAPESAREVVGAEEGKTARLGVARGSHMLPPRGEHGKESVNQLESLGLTVATQTEHEKESRNTSATPTTVTAKKPLPRLGLEEMQQRRILLDNFQASKVPINLGIKHTILEGQSQRIGATSKQLASSSSTEQTTGTPVPGRGGSVGGGSAEGDTDEFHPLPLQFIADHTCSHADGHLEDTVASEKFEDVDWKWAPRPPSQTGTVDSVSPLTIATPTVVASWTSTTATLNSSPTANQNRQGPGSPLLREVHAEEAEGPRDAVSVSETSTNRWATGSEGDIQIQTATEIAAIFSVPDAETVPENITKASAAGVQEEAGRSKFTTPVEITAKLGQIAQTVTPPRVVQEGHIAAENTSDRKRWPARLDARWAEVEFMLCHQVDCEETLKRTAKAAKEGLVFMDKLEKKAQELGVLKGQLSRWLLPYNADTSVEQQQAVTPRRVKESLMASSTTSAGGGVGALSEKEARYLTNSARELRRLVRLKIADDNDLNTAREALITMTGFFDSISEEASRRRRTTTAFDILQERRAISPISRPSLLPSKPWSSAAGLATASSSSAGVVDRTPVASFASGAKCEEGSSANSGQSALRTKKATCEVMRLLPTEENENRSELTGEADARRGGGGGCSLPSTRTKATAAPAVAASTTKPAISHKEEGGTMSCAKKVVPKATEEESAIKMDKTFVGSKAVVPSVSSRQAISSVEVTQKLEQAATRVTERPATAKAKEIHFLNSGAVRTKSGAIDHQVYSKSSRGMRAPAAEGILKPDRAWPSADAASTVSPYSKKSQGTPRTEARGVKGVSPPAIERFKRRRKKTR